MEADPEDEDEHQAGGSDHPAGCEITVAQTVSQIVETFSQHEAYAQRGRVVAQG